MNTVFIASLSLMLKGMVGIFVVILLIFLSIKALMKLFPAEE